MKNQHAPGSEADGYIDAYSGSDYRPSDLGSADVGSGDSGGGGD